MASRLAIDIGGGSTDLLLFDDSSGLLHSAKTTTSADDPGDSIRSGIEQLITKAKAKPTDVTQIVLASSVPRAALLRQQGAKVGLLVTENFEHVLRLGRGRTPAPLLGWVTKEPPALLADLEFTYGVSERTTAQGEILQPLEKEQAYDAIRQLLASGVESIAIALLHAGANSAHEQQLETMIAELGGNLPVCLSSDLAAGVVGEYERTLLTVINAYLQPFARDYAGVLEQAMVDVQLTAPVSIACSDNSAVSLAEIADHSHMILLADAAGGATGVAMVADQAGCMAAIGFEMGGGGSSFCAVNRGEPVLGYSHRLADYPLALTAPVTQQVALGGSVVAHIPGSSTGTGVLQLGPETAQPACFGEESGQATLLDANVVLGRVGTVAGRPALQAEAAQAVMAKLGQSLALDVYQTALAVVSLANEQLLGAMRVFAAKQSLDLTDMALVAGGGSGPLHANDMAVLSGCYPAIIPPVAAMFATLGLMGFADDGKSFIPKHSKAGSVEPALSQQQHVYFYDRFVQAAVYQRDQLNAGQYVSGPALIVQDTTTTVIHPEHRAEIDDYLNIIIYPDGGAA